MERKAYMLNEKDEKAIQLLVELGVPRNVARTLLYISGAVECHSAEIEHGAELRQPEVSIAIKKMKERGWVEEHHVKRKKGKGRPIHIYKLSKPLTEIVEEIKRDKMKEMKEIEKNISKLEKILSEKIGRMS